MCASIDAQTQDEWEHLVIVDLTPGMISRKQRRIIESVRQCPKRVFYYCDRKHNNYGHSCRHEIWEKARGDYILYIDDDDYLAHKEALSTLDAVGEPWAVFPVLRHGKLFLELPPGIGKTGTGMFVHRREIGRWPNLDAYEADGVFVEQLRKQYPFQVLNCEPLVIQPKSSYGVSNIEGWLGDKIARLVSRRLQANTKRQMAQQKPRSN